VEDQVITSYHRMPGFVHLESLGGSWCDEWSSISAILSYTPPGGWTMESEGNLGWPVDPPYGILRDLYHLPIQNLLKLWDILELRDDFFHEQCEKVKRVLREIFKLKMAMEFLDDFCLCLQSSTLCLLKFAAGQQAKSPWRTRSLGGLNPSWWDPVLSTGGDDESSMDL